MSSSPDFTLLNELYESIFSDPTAIPARKILIDHYLECNWLEAAVGAAKELLEFAPDDAEAKNLVSAAAGDFKGKSTASSKPLSKSALKKPLRPPRFAFEDRSSRPQVTVAVDDVESAQLALVEDYLSLLTEAADLKKQFQALRELQTLRDLSTEQCDEDIEILTNLSEHGSIIGNARYIPSVSVAAVAKPPSARVIAKSMEKEPDAALDIAVKYLSDIVDWLRAESHPTILDNDELRESLAKRVKTLSTALSKALQPLAATALMHAEHEVLQREYIVSETMLGDAVADIPRSHFLVTEDGYPWDVEELASALTANSGVMRNPLSKELFTVKDISAIVNHPLGKQLAAMSVEQSTLRKGVRPMTVTKLDSLSRMLLNDMSSDQLQSRLAVDEFLLYMATLPQSEQDSLNKLKVPARDTHTGQQFDATIGEAVRDAQGNRICFHKAGDLLGQAAKHLG